MLHVFAPAPLLSPPRKFSLFACARLRPEARPRLHSSPIPCPERSIRRLLFRVSWSPLAYSIPSGSPTWRRAASYHTSCAVQSPIIPRTGPVSPSPPVSGGGTMRGCINFPHLLTLRTVRSVTPVLDFLCSIPIRQLLAWKTATFNHPHAFRTLPETRARVLVRRPAIPFHSTYIRINPTRAWSHPERRVVPPHCP
ncbi:hypothetical protein L226DRAFT_246005 [Lentinus tigrinus ALCF2SS1-7]|uniref:Uncharacterized protein n=1 Tax=Lentinus tigrinus ALCF2SS1-6 TaxID=1328759 RepID=A0A5C2SNU9_9APHY|nr:hypothetical protein L227DRAFT_207804 [Lentinus tigrinus ALCF2SS1-6]RPD79291.1 hypothetical protein L226DRAFT_246005 [Lentinus tigrinus ALCF2SS1-7]